MKEIARLPSYGSFLDSYLRWKKEQTSMLRRIRRLECIHFYASHDTDGDGIPDWSAQADGRPSALLYPQDDDLDGDGSPNLLDPKPFDGSIKNEGKKIPAHLVAKEKKLQTELFEKHGILALDHTDTHSPAVLRALLFLLDDLLPKNFVRSLGGFRVLYAFFGHDREVDLAAYHQVAKAISIGGIHAYPATAPGMPDLKIVATLAHEIGHAFLLERVKAEELAAVAQKFGRWGPVAAQDLHDEAFLQAHPLRPLLRKSQGRGLASVREPDLAGLVSSYALANRHEWFAESFAAHVMVSAGEKGLLGRSWRSAMVTAPKSRRYHWANFQNIPSGLRAWLQRRIAP